MAKKQTTTKSAVALGVVNSITRLITPMLLPHQGYVPVPLLSKVGVPSMLLTTRQHSTVLGGTFLLH